MHVYIHRHFKQKIPNYDGEVICNSLNHVFKSRLIQGNNHELDRIME